MSGRVKTCKGVLIRSDEEWRHWIKAWAIKKSPNWKDAPVGRIVHQFGQPEQFPVVVSRFTDHGGLMNGDNGFLFVYLGTGIEELSIPFEGM